MARKKKQRIPTLGRHSSGQARVTINGKVYYLGLVDAPETHKRYSELVTRWIANGRQPLEPAATVVQARHVKDVLADYEQYLDASGRYQKDGQPTSARRRIARDLREFAATCGTMFASKLSDVMVLRHRDALEARERLTRGGINRKLRAVQSALRWAHRRGVLTREQWLGIAAIEPLARHECGGRDWRRSKRAVSLEDIERTAQAAPPMIARMLRVQAATGMRPGEVCSMRWCDLLAEKVDVDGVQVVIYRVASAKTAHHGHETTYALPPSTVALLGAPTSPSAPVFSTPQGKRYHGGVYRNAVVKACLLAGVQPFSPHEVRHGFLTRAVQRYGILAASAAANHSSTQVTSGYLHKDRTAGYRVAVGMAEGGAS